MNLDEYAVRVNAHVRVRAPGASPHDGQTATQTPSTRWRPLSRLEEERVEFPPVPDDVEHSALLSVAPILDRSSLQRAKVGEIWLAEARVQAVGAAHVREILMLVDGQRVWLLADDADPAPYGRGHVDRLLSEMDLRGGYLLVERRPITRALDGPARGGWVAVVGGAP